MTEEINSTYTDEVVCPHCGLEHGDSWELGLRSGDNGEQKHTGYMRCQNDDCGKEFTWEREIEAHYTTYPKQ